MFIRISDLRNRFKAPREGVLHVLGSDAVDAGKLLSFTKIYEHNTQLTRCTSPPNVSLYDSCVWYSTHISQIYQNKFSAPNWPHPTAIHRYTETLGICILRV